MQTEHPHILLLCLNPLDPSQLPPSLSCDDLFLIFSVFSPMRKIIIFSKSPVLKAFVEFSSSEGAKMALKELHNRKLDDLGKMKLFESKLRDLQVGTNFLGFKDYSGIDRNLFLEKIQQKIKTAKQSYSNLEIKKKIITNPSDILSVVDEVPEKEELNTDLSEIVEISDFSRTPSPHKENKMQVNC